MIKINVDYPAKQINTLIFALFFMLMFLIFESTISSADSLPYLNTSTSAGTWFPNLTYNKNIFSNLNISECNTSYSAKSIYLKIDNDSFIMVCIRNLTSNTYYRYGVCNYSTCVLYNKTSNINGQLISAQISPDRKYLFTTETDARVKSCTIGTDACAVSAAYFGNLGDYTWDSDSTLGDIGVYGDNSYVTFAVGDSMYSYAYPVKLYHCPSISSIIGSCYLKSWYHPEVPDSYPGCWNPMPGVDWPGPNDNVSFCFASDIEYINDTTLAFKTDLGNRSVYYGESEFWVLIVDNNANLTHKFTSPHEETQYAYFILNNSYYAMMYNDSFYTSGMSSALYTDRYFERCDLQGICRYIYAYYIPYSAGYVGDVIRSTSYANDNIVIFDGENNNLVFTNYNLSRVGYVNVSSLSLNQSLTYPREYDVVFFKDYTFINGKIYNNTGLVVIKNGTCFDGILNQNETEIDYGGICGYCIANTTVANDDMWLLAHSLFIMEDFDSYMCESAPGAVGGALIVFLLLFLMMVFLFFLLLGFLIMSLIFYLSRRRKKKKQLERNDDKKGNIYK